MTHPRFSPGFYGVRIAFTVASYWLISKGHRAASAPELGLLFLGVMILASTITIVLGVKVGGHSLWPYVYRYFPGGGAIRAAPQEMSVGTAPPNLRPPPINVNIEM